MNAQVEYGARKSQDWPACEGTNEPGNEYGKIGIQDLTISSSRFNYNISLRPKQVVGRLSKEVARYVSIGVSTTILIIEWPRKYEAYSIYKTVELIMGSS